MNEFLITLLILNTIHGIGTWKLYNISGNKSWQSFIPVYNVFILLKIINRPWWWIFIIIIPVLNTIILPVIWVEISRSFKKNTYTDTFLSIFSLGFYNYYINYFTKAEYVKNRDINPKSTSGEWTSSIIFAVIAATFVHTYFMQPYTIPTSSLEKSLLVGDFLFVSKFHYGARVPMTPIAAPMVHDTLPFNLIPNLIFGTKYKEPSFRSYINKEQLPILAELPYMRLPGFQKIKRNDIVCFNWPVDTMVNMFYTDKNYYKPIDKKTNYVKRAVGIAGDTLEIKNGFVYINGSKNKLPDRAELQFSYRVDKKDPSIRFDNSVLYKYGITDFPYQPRGNTAIFPGISNKSYELIKRHPNVKEIIPLRDDMEPIIIPKKNKIIELDINDVHFKFYRRAIQVYENNDFKLMNEKIFINGIETNKYTFKQDYFWLMGDNRGNSQDSRSWGFVPFDHVVGKPVFKWLSIDYNAKGLNKIRWDRMFTTVHGEGKPTSYFLHFIAVIILWNVISYFRRKKLQ